MSFYEKMDSIGYTENGARGLKHTNNPIVDLNFSIPKLRSDDEFRTELFKKALAFDRTYALKWVLFARDVRGGLQERFSPVKMLELLFNSTTADFVDYPSYIKAFINCGRFDDVMKATDLKKINKDIKEIIFKVIKVQLASDDVSEAPSLLAKYFSVNNSKRKKSSESEHVLRKHAFIRAYVIWDLNINTPKALNAAICHFRKRLSKIRAKIKPVEILISANKWSEVDYEKLPSKANIKYKKAFLKHDEARREAYIDKVESGDAKINVATNSLPDLWSKINHYSDNADKMLEVAMAEMIKKMPLINKRMMVCVDDSGSMESRISMQNITALDVAHSLGVAIASRMAGDLHKKILTFSNTPRVLDFNKFDTFRDIKNYLRNHSEVANTDINRVFMDLLSLNLPAEDMPEIVLCISDMEFDSSAVENDSLFNKIQNDYNAKGYKLPKIVMWNVNSRTNTMPFETLKNGGILVGGYSLNILKMVLSFEFDSWKTLKEQLDNERYNF